MADVLASRQALAPSRPMFQKGSTVSMAVREGGTTEYREFEVIGNHFDMSTHDWQYSLRDRSTSGPYKQGCWYSEALLARSEPKAIESKQSGHFSRGAARGRAAIPAGAENSDEPYWHEASLTDRSFSTAVSRPSASAQLANAETYKSDTHLTTDGPYKNSVSLYDYGQAGLVPPSTPTGPEASKKYLGVKDFAGEGAFHLYEGRYRIPTHVDGEQVNPQWGLTKANKPRKRLALACLDCRMKKIKCEPGASSCLQCERAKRICRMSEKNNVAGGPAHGRGLLKQAIRRVIMARNVSREH